jgi:hypothetical protein
VHWPSGRRDTRVDVDANQRLRIRESLPVATRSSASADSSAP